MIDKCMPMVALRGMVVYPQANMNIDIGREKSLKALNAAMDSDSILFVVAQKEASKTDAGIDDLYEVGTVVKIMQAVNLHGDTIRVIVEGQSRGRIKSCVEEDPYFSVEVELIEDDEHIYDKDQDNQIEALIRNIKKQFVQMAEITNRISAEIILAVDVENDPQAFVDKICANALYKLDHKQELLTIIPALDRLERLYELLQNELEILKIEKKISLKVRRQMDKMQKEHYLHEQIKAIQSELGQGDENEVDEQRKRIEELPLEDLYKKKILKELNRLSRLPSSSPEVGVLKTWLDWIFDMPWTKQTEDSLDLKNAQKVLDEDHYGLAKVKERIVEYLAVRAMTKSMKGPVLCFVGPPGVGKTSIAKSIARATNREFTRMSLGGLRDEAEIRGHRRTYIGAIPGRIISNIKGVGTKNPVFLLDEIEKMSNDFRGDPSSALLEVFDAEQNKTFTDHYLEVPFDLSQVMFLATANTLDTVPPALLDRMEIIYISGYTDEEKLNIAKRHLMPKQLKEHGLEHGSLFISDKIMLEIINGYTREAGVRNLEREIANICRKCTRELIEKKKKSIRLTQGNLEKYIGIKKYIHEDANQQNEIGVATGLAWTKVGGVTLNIEVIVMEGSGKLELTGQLGDVMKESAQAALSYIRAHAKELKIEGKFYEDKDIHIHIPEGATPKDGPSAGITMATAMISALANIPIKCSVAMTGEITLRGRVLPIGGLKEKTLAAHRAGISTVIIPKDNEKDVPEIPEKIRKSLNIISASSLDEVLSYALERSQDDAEQKA